MRSLRAEELSQSQRNQLQKEQAIQCKDPDAASAGTWQEGEEREEDREGEAAELDLQQGRWAGKQS